jgi:hypothetical protein
VFSRLIANWFYTKRGMALGLALVGGGLTTMLVPYLITLAISANGWRTAYLLLSGLTLVIAPLALLVVRNNPASVGATVDGETRRGLATSEPSAEEAGLSLNEAFRTRVFWTMAFAALTLGMGLIPLFLQMVRKIVCPPRCLRWLALHCVFRGLLGVAEPILIIGERVMDQHTDVFVGIDVGKSRNAIAIADSERGGEVRYFGEVDAAPDAMRRAVQRITAKHGRAHFCYKAGSTGYGLFRLITGMGYPCDVVAPSLIPRRPGDRVKTNRRDAVGLAKLLRAGELTPVWVPDEGHEAMRDLVRARSAAVKAQRVHRQQVSAFRSCPSMWCKLGCGQRASFSGGLWCNL